MDSISLSVQGLGKIRAPGQVTIIGSNGNHPQNQVIGLPTPVLIIGD
jgi:hypothetical protein